MSNEESGALLWSFLTPESIALWLESEGWVYNVSCQYWQHPKLGQADDIWAALNRQLEG